MAQSIRIYMVFFLASGLTICAVQYYVQLSTTGGQAAACAPVTQRARIRSLVGTGFMVWFFWGFPSPVRQMSGSFRPPKVPEHHLAIIIITHQSSFITGANDLRC